MKNHSYKNVICQALAAVSLGMTASSAHAISVDWTGNYRIEYTEVDRTSLDDPKLRKSYLLNHLSLSPKIIAADGVNIFAKFEVLPNDLYPDSQAGQPFGRGPTKAAGTGGSSTRDDSAVAGDKQGSTTLRVNQLYLNLNQEYGSLVAGRAPLDFGLGMTHSAGNGPFDHWYSTRDMIGYKVIIGNFSLMPMIAKVSDQTVAQGEEVQDIIIDAMYNNPETESAIGVMHQTRSSSNTSNDAPAANLGGTTPATTPTGLPTGAWKTQNVNIYFARGFEDVKFKLEAGFASGSTGVFRPNNEEVSLNGYGIALEADFPRPESKLHYTLRAGVASGDNPSTTNYEGFQFHRNYDVALLMFNHPLGKYDLLRSAAQRSPARCGTAPCAPFATDEALDDEAISNAIYVSPKVVYNINEKWDWVNTFTWAQLQTNPLSDQNIDVAKDLGFEWDTGAVYRPYEKVMWVNELGLLFPGSAWAGGSNDFGKGFTYGFTSKAVISF